MDMQQAQDTARDLLTTAFGVTIESPIVLSDVYGVYSPGQYVITPTRLEAAADQYRQITGESVDHEAITAALDWV